MKLISLLHPSTGLLPYLVEPALRSLAVGCVAGLLLAVTRSKRAALRLAVWTSVLYVALAMPPLGALLPHIKLAVPATSVAAMKWRTGGSENVATQTATAPSMANSSQSPSISQAGIYSPGSSQPTRTAPETSKPKSAFSFSAPPVSTPAVMPGATAPPYAPSLPRAVWEGLALMIYLVGFAILSVRLLAGLCWSRRLACSAKDIEARYFAITDDFENQRNLAALDLLHSGSRRMGLKKRPRLKESDALSVPATVGALQPVILLPAGWREWPDEQLEAVLAHEISHVARRDARTQLLSLLHRAIFWFSPLAWWLHRQLTELAEQASDEAALAAGADRTRYAETLLGFFTQLESMPSRVRWQAVSMANRDVSGRAERRVDRILAWKGTSSMKKSLIIALVAFAAPVIFLAASVHPFIAYAQAKAEPSAPFLAAATAPSATAAVTSAKPPASAAIENPPQLGTAQGPAADGDAQQVDKQSNTTANTNQFIHGSSSFGSGPRYVLMSANSKDVSMSGNDEDLMHAQELRKKISGDFIWFERDEKSYVITDPAFIARVRALFAPEDALAKQEDELGRQEDALGRQEDALGEQSEKVKVKVPDITADLERIRGHLKELQAGGATQSELGAVQAQIGQVQSQLGHFQSQAGQQQSLIGRQQAELGRKQAELGRQQAELGRQQAEIAGRASRELRGMFDDAITKGIAKPE